FVRTTAAVTQCNARQLERCRRNVAHELGAEYRGGVREPDIDTVHDLEPKRRTVFRTHPATFHSRALEHVFSPPRQPPLRAEQHLPLGHPVAVARESLAYETVGARADPRLLGWRYDAAHHGVERQWHGAQHRGTRQGSSGGHATAPRGYARGERGPDLFYGRY